MYVLYYDHVVLYAFLWFNINIGIHYVLCDQYFQYFCNDF